ncbi:MAG: tripartite tricarboxylate transporter TctB family protein [Sphaerochaetaceae bacterium]
MIILKPVGFLIPSFLMLTGFIYWFSKEPDESFVAKKAKSNFGQLLNAVFDNVDGLRQARPLWLCAVIALIATFSVYFIFKLGLNVPMNFGLYI